MAAANLALTIGAHEEHPGSPTPVQADTSVLKADANIPTHQQDTARVSIVAQKPQHHSNPKSNNAVTPSTGSILALGSSGSRVSLSGQGPSSDDTGHGQWFERAFYMVIHLNDRMAQRVTCLDAGSDLDVISHQVVVDLGLQPERARAGFSLSFQHTAGLLVQINLPIQSPNLTHMAGSTFLDYMAIPRMT